ncbi:MAG TPA: RNA methyltransferase [Ignavibacteriaceae bacterium]|nr:RNA methyltransferase [Ignavibacteriaceae bacterium]
MKSNRTENREQKIFRVAASRQFDFNIVLENIHDPHNVSAIFRSCDAVGIPEICLVYNKEQFPRIGKKSSASAFKWVKSKKYKSIAECYNELHDRGFKIYASSITEKSKSLYDLDLSENTAIVLGNEHRGVSSEAQNLADDNFMIPMHGMVQSLNVSVAAAVILYEAMRQREIKGLYPFKKNKTAEMSLIEEWMLK